MQTDVFEAAEDSVTFTGNKPVSVMNLQLVASTPSFNIRALQKFVGFFNYSYWWSKLAILLEYLNSQALPYTALAVLPWALLPEHSTT